MSQPEPGGSAPGRLVAGACIALLCLIWGSTWLVIKTGLRDLPPLGSAGVRFAVAGTVMALLAPLLRRAEGGQPPGARLVLASGLLNFGLSYGLVYWSETRLPSGLVAVLWATFPPLMAVAAHAFIPGERMTARQGAGVLLAYGGVVALFLTDVRAAGPDAVPTALVLLLSPAASVVGHVVLKRAGSGWSSVLLNRDGMLLGAACLLGAALLLERGREVRWTGTAAFSVAYLAVVGTVVAFGLYFWLLRRCRASRLGLIAFVVPVVALSLGTLVGDEPLRATTLAGSALVVAGVALATYSGPVGKRS